MKSNDEFVNECFQQFNSNVAVRPGAHATASALSSEYDSKIVSSQLDFLRESESWSVEKMSVWVSERLRSLLQHAGATVPFYSRLFAKVGFDPRTARLPEDLEVIPLLTKETIREHQYELISRAYNPKNLVYMTTGGSTGNPLRIVMDREFRSMNHANTHYYLNLAGYSLGNVRSVRLHGDVLGCDRAGVPIKWIIEGRRLTMSVFNLTKRSVPEYVDAINRFAPSYIHGFPSALVLLARGMSDLGIHLEQPMESVFTDSETTLDFQRELIQEHLGGQIFNTYGHTEGAVLGVTFPGSQNVALVPQVGYTEMVVPTGSPSNFNRREIVVTGLNNWAFPLIRYRTGDLGIPSLHDGLAPQSYMELSKIEGRIQDYVVDSKGQWIAINPALFDYNFDWSGIERFQVQQSAPGELKFAFIPDNSGVFRSEELASRIRNGFQEILGPNFRVDAIESGEISLTARGKFRYVDQSIKLGPPDN